MPQAEAIVGTGFYRNAAPGTFGPGEWLDLLMACQDGRATCLRVMEYIERETVPVGRVQPPEALLEEMTNAFLRWPLPDSVCSDACCMEPGYKHRTGTNLMNVVEAAAMMNDVVKPVILRLLAAGCKEGRPVSPATGEREAELREVAKALALKFVPIQGDDVYWLTREEYERDILAALTPLLDRREGEYNRGTLFMMKQTEEFLKLQSEHLVLRTLVAKQRDALAAVSTWFSTSSSSAYTLNEVREIVSCAFALTPTTIADELAARDARIKELETLAAIRWNTIEGQERRLAVAKQSISGLWAHNADVKLKLAEAQTEIARINEIVSHPATLRHHVQKLFPEYRWEHPEYISRLESAAQRVDELEAQLTAAQAEIDRLTGAMSMSEAKAHEKAADLRVKLAAAKQAFDDLWVREATAKMQLVEAQAEIARLEAQSRKTAKEWPINTHIRLFDLVRQQRTELHEADLITDEEYAWLSGGDPLATNPKGGSPSPRRLEDYDDLRAKLTAAQTSLRESEAARGEDSKRLDWLETGPILPMDNGDLEQASEFRRARVTRATIDAARAQEAKP